MYLYLSTTSILRVSGFEEECQEDAVQKENVM